MKRSIPPPTRPKGFLTQKKIRIYLDLGKESVKPLNQHSEEPYVQERGSPLTAELRHAMYRAVKGQLDDFKEKEETLSCAFNKEHTRNEYVASHYIRYFDELASAFLKMFSSLRLPVEYEPNTGEFIAKDEIFERTWTSFHLKRANLRILCKSCHLLHTSNQYVSEKKPLGDVRPVLSLNEALKPYKKELEHPWLDILSWGSASNKGNYSRKLGDKPFTLFIRDNKWNYVYDNKFGDTPQESLKQLLNETYLVFGDLIRRFL